MQSGITPAAEADCTGLYCPMPIAMAREKIETIAVGEVLLVVADDPAAGEDIPRWAKRAGHELVKSEESGGVMTFYIRRGK